MLAALPTPAPLNPLNAITAGLTAPWFLIISILMLRSDFPKLLGYLGFIASLIGIDALAMLTAIIAGAVGGPVFWLWLGSILWRET